MWLENLPIILYCMPMNNDTLSAPGVQMLKLGYHLAFMTFISVFVSLIYFLPFLWARSALMGRY